MMVQPDSWIHLTLSPTPALTPSVHHPAALHTPVLSKGLYDPKTSKEQSVLQAAPALIWKTSPGSEGLIQP